ncbi:MAG: hypothetical protein QOG70_3136 [Solirubrobacteraceae bacterium]|jgi:hypothetical protein|nr:hypothetical protein [Solirubrobacteraceae bacterium]
MPSWAAALALVVLAGGAARVAHAVHHGRFLSTDERAYAKLAAALAAGHGYRAPKMNDPLHWPPGTPVLFAGGRLVGGVEGQYWAQLVVGVALIVVVFALARAIAGPWAGVAAAAAVALYPPLAVLTGDLVSEPLGALTLAVAVLALVRAWRGPPGWSRFALAGGALGVAVLVRADLLALPFVLAVLVAIVARGWRAPLAYLGAAILVVAPWSAYATHRNGGELVPVASSSWSSLFVGTYLPADGRQFRLRTALGDEARAHNPLLRGVPDDRLRAEWILDAVAARHPHLDRNAAMKAEVQRNLRVYALGHPLDFAAMQARKVARMWLGYDRGTHHNRRDWILALHLLLAAGGLAGLLLGLVRTRHPALWAILLTVLTVTAVNSFFVSEARHNVRVMGLLLAGGAAGVALSRRGRAARSGPPRGGDVRARLASAARPRDAARAR